MASYALWNGINGSYFNGKTKKKESVGSQQWWDMGLNHIRSPAGEHSAKYLNLHASEHQGPKKSKNIQGAFTIVCKPDHDAWNDRQSVAELYCFTHMRYKRLRDFWFATASSTLWFFNQINQSLAMHHHENCHMLIKSHESSLEPSIAKFNPIAQNITANWRPLWQAYNASFVYAILYSGPCQTYVQLSQSMCCTCSAVHRPFQVCAEVWMSVDYLPIQGRIQFTLSIICLVNFLKVPMGLCSHCQVIGCQTSLNHSRNWICDLLQFSVLILAMFASDTSDTTDKQVLQ